MRLDGYRARQSLIGQSVHCANSYIHHVQHIMCMLRDTGKSLGTNKFSLMYGGHVFRVNPTYGVLQYYSTP